MIIWIQLEKLWRLFATVLAFVVLGLGGPIMTLTLFYTIILITPNKRRRRQRIRRVIHYSFRLYIILLCVLRVIRLTVVHRERLHGLTGSVIIANHPTLLDVVLLISLVPNAQCVVKGGVWRNPFFYPVVSGAEYIRSDQPPETVIARCVESLHQGDNLIIFPEGTRTFPFQPELMKRGFANIALAAQTRIQLFFIQCTPLALTKEMHWYNVPERVPAFRVEVGEQVDILPFLGDPSRYRASCRLTSHVAQYFSEKFSNDRPFI
ncbi:MAG: 1-acyl-sn-glycerol-3-phosphate acyltransferase [Magnetococcales bacterium]|nr:1-acyl-sn-glycerol-3-phosphate acyltransferase [Magnetococcales bacterium]